MNGLAIRLSTCLALLVMLALIVPGAVSAQPADRTQAGLNVTGAVSIGQLDRWIGVRTAGDDPIDCMLSPGSWPNDPFVSRVDIIGGPATSCFPSTRVAPVGLPSAPGSNMNVGDPK
jgi:hypothetical protein